MNRIIAISSALLCFGLQMAPAFQGGKATTGGKANTGTVQMPGDKGKVGTIYRLGKKGEELDFTLEKAEFASRFIMSNDVGWPSEGHRYIVLTYAVQNPGQNDRQFMYQSFSFTFVSPDDENYVGDGLHANGWCSVHPTKREVMAVMLKPAQKVHALAVVEIHQKGPVNKLIVQRGQNTPVLRYDLKEKVKPLVGAYAANDGLDSMDIGKAEVLSPFELGPYDVVVEKVDIVPGDMGEYSADGGKFIVLTMGVTNVANNATAIHGSMLTGILTDLDGGTSQSTALLKMSANERLETNLDAAQTIHVRQIYRISASAIPAKIRLNHANSNRFCDVVIKLP